MTTQPSANPFWLRSSTINDYGGDVDKYDLNNVAPINPLTDVTASQFKSLSNDLVAANKTAALALITLDTSTDGYQCDIVKASTNMDLPLIERTGASTILISYPSLVTDIYGQEAPVVLQGVAVQDISEFQGRWRFYIDPLQTNEIVLTNEDPIVDDETIFLMVF
jgi:hypothetical protein